MKISRHDAERAVHAELGKRKLREPMTPAEMLAFTTEMYRKLDFPTKGDRLQDIRTWTERWQHLWLTDQTSN